MDAVTLSCSIMAHPKRAAMVDELVGWLDRPVEVVWDQVNDRHDTGARAMAAFNPDCTHHMVVQDDVVPCRDLIAGAEAALVHTPGDVPVSLYLGSVRPFQRLVVPALAEHGDSVSWMTMSGIYWGPAVILPTESIPPMLEWYRTSRVQNYDRRMSTWFARRGVRCWYSWPSLVEHRGDESLSHQSGGVRRAHRSLGATESALDVDWTRGVAELRATENADRRRQLDAKRAARKGR